MSTREELCRKYKTKNVQIAIHRAVRAELNGGSLLQDLHDAHQLADATERRYSEAELAPKVRALEDEIRRRYGLPVRTQAEMGE